MLVLVDREELLHFLHEDALCWGAVSGGPNFNAFSFDPKTVDTQKLKELGYYENREAWMAGVQSKKIASLIDQLKKAPQARPSGFR